MIDALKEGKGSLAATSAATTRPQVLVSPTFSKGRALVFCKTWTIASSTFIMGYLLRRLSSGAPAAVMHDSAIMSLPDTLLIQETFH